MAGLVGYGVYSYVSEQQLKALLPEGWEKDFTTFFALDGGVLMSLMAFCTACSVDGVQTRDMGHTSRSTLDTVEAAIGFHLRDWWQPTKENYFGSLKHPQIVASLKEAGLTGAAVVCAAACSVTLRAMAAASMFCRAWSSCSRRGFCG